MNIKEFGDYLKQIRTGKKLKLTEVAKTAGITHSYLSQIENGKLSKMPSLDVVFELSEALSIDFYGLMQAAGYEPTHFKRKKVMRSLNIMRCISDDEFHWAGYYPTPEERKIMFRFMDALFADKISSVIKKKINKIDDKKENDNGTTET